MKNSSDRSYAFTRSDENKRSNNDVRALFRQTVANLFGGEDNIPPGVKTAMRLGDYNKGRPLTARRIAKVEIAILNHLFATGSRMSVGGNEIGTGDLARIFKGDLKPEFLVKPEDNATGNVPGSTVLNGNNPSINDVDDDTGGVNATTKKRFNELKAKADSVGGPEKLPPREKIEYYTLNGQMQFQQHLDGNPGKKKNIYDVFDD